MAFDAAGASSLEQFTLLAKNARGRACVALVQQVLTNKKLFVFRELLNMPNVEALQNTENHGYYELLRIFCFGTYGDYLARKDELPALTPQQVQKLRKLTVVSLAHRYKLVPYDVLMEGLDVPTVRELEDILIETIYSGLVQGKLDQKSRSFVVKYAVGRDTQNEDIDSMIAKLTSWYDWSRGSLVASIFGLEVLNIVCCGIVHHVNRKTESANIRTKINDILIHAENLAETEKAREESIRNKIASRANSDRAKYPGGAPGYRPNDDFGMFPESGGYGGARRGPPGSKQRMHSMGRKGRN